MSIKLTHKVTRDTDGKILDEEFLIRRREGFSYSISPKELLELKAELEKIKLEHE